MNHETTDLREKLNKLIIELDILDITLDSPASSMTLGEYEQERERLLDEFVQTIAATLGSNAKQCYATDYTHEHCKYSVNRGWLEDTKFYIPTPDTLGSGTLTYEHVEDVVFSNCELCGNSFVDIRAITDELNATLVSGACEFVVKDNMNETEGAGDVWFECNKCGAQFDYVTDTRLMDANFCPHCGKKVKR